METFKKDFSERPIEKRTCPICKKTCEATLEFVFWCKYCRRWICRKPTCRTTCKTCLVEELCIEDAERLRQKYDQYSPLPRCERCHQFLNDSAEKNK